MKRKKPHIVFRNKHREGEPCDNCGEMVSINRIETTVFVDGEENQYNFCDNQCLLDFSLQEIKKENPNTDTLYGKGK